MKKYEPTYMMTISDSGTVLVNLNTGKESAYTHHTGRIQYQIGIFFFHHLVCEHMCMCWYIRVCYTS
jgi:hypothetical protein